ncbi:MAG: hypothetical protein WB992_15480, partial [Bryobacteraceae bacterium]
MAFCPNCGAQVPGSFCPNCGTAVAGAGAGSGPAAGPGVGPTTGAAYVPPPQPGIQAAGLTQNTASALCYLFGLVTGIVFLVLAPYNQNKIIRFHAFQSIFTHVGIIVVGILFTIITHGLGIF